MSADQRIAVVGFGGVFPGAADLEEYWAKIRAGLSSIDEVPAERWPLSFEEIYAPAPAEDRVYSRRAGFINPDFDFDLEGLQVDGPLLSRLDPLFRLLLHAGREAWKSAALKEPDRERCGIIVGNIVLPTDGSAALTEEILGPAFEAAVLGAEASATGNRTEKLNRCVAGLPAGMLARALDLHGGAFTLDAACSSSLYALKLAGDELIAGRADVMLSGGLSRPDSLYTQSGFSQLRALSPRGVCSPFDEEGDGLVVGEGAGVVVLKRLADAERDGDHIHAVITGIGLSNDIGGNIMAPDSEGQLRAMRGAYEKCGWEVDDVDLIECHGTGTPVGDAVEFSSLTRLWQDAVGDRRAKCVIGSVKSNVGHLLTAAGAAGLIKVLMALRDRKLPPTANFHQPPKTIDLEGSPFTVLKEEREWDPPPGNRPRRAAVSAFGFGGTNAHVLIEEWRPVADGQTSPVLRSTKSPPSPAVAIVGMDAHIGPWDSLAEITPRLLGRGADHAPAAPRRAFGTVEAGKFRLHAIDEIAIPLSRFRIPPRELEEMLPQQLLILQVAANAFEDAGISQEGGPAKLRTGVFIGLGLDLNTTNFRFRWEMVRKARRWERLLELDLDERSAAAWLQELRSAASPPLTANRTMGALGSIAASRVARAFRIGGAGFTVSSEESSGLHALETGVRALQQGELDTVLVGAVDLAGDVRNLLAQPDRGRSPVFGEGACALVLKRHEDARRDGNRVYALVTGVGKGHAAAEGSTGPAAPAFDLAFERALADGDVAPETISLFEAVGGLDAEEMMGEEFFKKHFPAREGKMPCALASVEDDIGFSGAASALASIAKAASCLHNRIIPPLRRRSPAPGHLWQPAAPQYWLRDRVDGPRRAAVASFSGDGNCAFALLEEDPATPIPLSHPLGDLPRTLLVFEGDDKEEIGQSLEDCAGRLASSSEAVAVLARRRLAEVPPQRSKKMALTIVSESRNHLKTQLAAARRRLVDSDNGSDSGERDGEGGVFFTASPLFESAPVAFVYPGSGMNFPGMARELGAEFPLVVDRLDRENDRLAGQFGGGRFWTGRGEVDGGHSEEIFGQVWTGTLVSDVIASFGVTPNAVIGYSLGETAGLFATRTWRARDEMLERILATSLFTEDLAGPCLAARKVWKMGRDEEVDWHLGVAGAPAERVNEVLARFNRLYLLIVNTPEECVIGGDRAQLEEAVRELKCAFFPLTGVTTVHCPVAEPVKKPYRDLHLFPTLPPPGISFYSGHWGRAYDVSTDSCADSIVGQALAPFDYTRLVNRAYDDGLRIFIEMGPGSSCTRMIDSIIAGRPHLALAACHPGENNLASLFTILARLISERVPLSLENLFRSEERGAAEEKGKRFIVRPGHPPFRIPAPPRRRQPAKTPTAVEAPPPSSGFSGIAAQARRCEEAAAATQQAYLNFAEETSRSMSRGIDLQLRLLDKLGAPGQAAVPAASGVPPAAGGGAVLDYDQCMEFAVGSIARVLGDRFAAVDSFPTRVRLPDEPLMLVDRIMEIEGEAASLTRGRVVTEHDIKAGAWYLDHARMPTCIAVEAGQADLFLSGYLGIDLHTRGLAVYRLLDASIVFHRGLPGPGSTVRYEINIDTFFSQGETKLFRFRFEATVDGAPLLSMSDGVAGFFTLAELEAGRGVVLSEEETREERRSLPADWETFVPMSRESFKDEQVQALSRGDLEGCFGPEFTSLEMKNPPGLPSGRMTLVHRIVDLDPEGGRYGLGQITGEADIRPDDWFLTCHFCDDHVMPGTLMYECCLHTLRVYLLRLGWLGEADSFVYEPIPGEVSSLRCRGQVLETTKKVQYRITIRELGYRGAEETPFVLADAMMYVDGKPAIQMTNMSLRLQGLTRAGISDLWAKRRPTAVSTPRPAIFDEEKIRQFTEGKPSLAFGDRYKAFDEKRVIARLPRAPYRFLDRIVEIRNCEQWKLEAGGEIVAQYDVPPGEWYFLKNGQDRSPEMPFAILLEVALQPCGWLAAYLGSALTSDIDLSFRNLGGTAVQRRPVRPDEGTLSVEVKITGVSQSAGMIIQNFDFLVRSSRGVIYSGDTVFGFFAKSALADQVGISDAQLYAPSGVEMERADSFPFPEGNPFPDEMLRMIDRIDHFDPQGGPAGLGFIEGSLEVRPAWFYEAHFFQDPVTPGSLGLESFLQLLKVYAMNRWNPDGRPGSRFEAMTPDEKHRWVYRGQIIQADKLVKVQACVTAVDDDRRTVRADGWLSVDGRVIYKMVDFSLAIRV